LSLTTLSPFSPSPYKGKGNFRRGASPLLDSPVYSIGHFIGEGQKTACKKMRLCNYTNMGMTDYFVLMGGLRGKRLLVFCPIDAIMLKDVK
jgi:hypothetical protein